MESNGNDVNGETPGSAIDFSKGVDWGQACELANGAVRKLDLVGRLKPQDRSLLIKGAALEQFVERVFNDAVDQTAKKFRSGERPRKSVCAYLHTAMARKLGELGFNFNGSLLAIDVPEQFLRPPPRGDP